MLQERFDRVQSKNDSDIIWISDSNSEKEDIEAKMDDICRTSAIAQHDAIYSIHLILIMQKF